MIYDRGPLQICAPLSPPVEDRIRLVSEHYYAELEVYHRRFWESVQAGDRVDLLVRVPFGEELRADLYCIPEDGHVYRVQQAQHRKDDNALPCCTLSLHREEANYDIIRIRDDS